MDVYEGTDLLVRECGNGSCGDFIERPNKMFVDLAAGIVLCEACRWDAEDWYRSETEWKKSLVKATKLIKRGMIDDINNLEE